jgi:hypothetical protein
MDYKKSPFKMAPKSPMLKALKGNQNKLPQQLQDAIEAAPESPTKQTVGPKPAKKISSGEELTGKKPKANKTFKKEPLGPYKPAPKSPAKVKDPVTGSKVKGYAKSDLKVDRVRDKQERKETKSEKLATAKSDGKVTRLEKKGIRESQADLKNKQVAKRNNKFQDQKVRDKKHKESTKLRVKSKKLNDAVAVGLDKKEAQNKMDKAVTKANKRVAKSTKRAESRKF